MAVGGVQRHQNMVVARPEAADPVVRRAGSDIAEHHRPRRRPGLERRKRLEREVGYAIPHPHRGEAGPRDAEVQPVGNRGRRLGGGRDLRRVGLVAADQPAEQCAGGRWVAHLQQEMPQGRQEILAQDDALDVGKL
jgi:hypothetical protein